MGNRALGIILLALVGIILIGSVGMGSMMGVGMMGPGMMGGYGLPAGATVPGGWGLAMGVGWLAMIASWAAVVLGIVLLVRWVTGRAESTSHPTEEEPLTILRRRYASGELDETTYEHMRERIAA